MKSATRQVVLLLRTLGKKCNAGDPVLKKQRRKYLDRVRTIRWRMLWRNEK